MEHIYHKTSFQISKLITGNYSTSFSLGIKAFSPDFRDPIYSIYGYVRLADEIVDSFHNYDKGMMLEEFRRETFKALETGISLNPVINAFIKTVKKYNIDTEYIHNFLDSMGMDLSNGYYEKVSYDNYIYGSAEVVGLMCLKVFCNGNEVSFDKLLGHARSLGSAFQKVNFLRDIKSDIEERGRIYLPDVDSKIKIDEVSKKRLEEDIIAEFHNALKGIKMLPMGAKLGVYSAYLYYWFLFKKIERTKIATLLTTRVRISNSLKFMLLLKSIVEVKVLKTI